MVHNCYRVLLDLLVHLEIQDYLEIQYVFSTLHMHIAPVLQFINVFVG